MPELDAELSVFDDSEARMVRISCPFFSRGQKYGIALSVMSVDDLFMISMTIFDDLNDFYDSISFDDFDDF